MAEPVPVGFQGRPGAFSEEALLAATDGTVTPRGFRTAKEVGRAVMAGDIPFGFLPLENSIAGAVTSTYDVLDEAPLKVVGEVVMPIAQCLLGRPGSTIPDIRQVLSHPVALAQCNDFFARNPTLHPGAASDTAGAAEHVDASGDASLGAIAPRSCAHRYGLSILAEGIQDDPANRTRWIWLTLEANSDIGPAVGVGINRLMLVASIPHEPGSLATLLQAIATGGHNVMKLEGRPADTPWAYRFYLEIEPAGPFDAEEIRRKSGSHDLRIIGDYARIEIGAPE